MILASIKET
jgi:hypothetical protein